MVRRRLIADRGRVTDPPLKLTRSPIQANQRQLQIDRPTASAGCRRCAIPFDSRSSSSNPDSASSSIRVPARGLLGQLLRAERLQLERADQVGRTRAGVDVVAHDDQLAQAAVDLRDQQRHCRAGVEQAIGELGGFGGATATERVEEGPR